MTTGEGEKMRADIASLRTKLDEIEKRDKEYKEQVVRLRTVLDQATKLLTRNSADVGAKAAKAEQDIAVLQGRIEELAHAIELQNRQAADERNRLETRLAALEQTQTKIVDKVAPTMPDDKEQLWQQAAQRLASGSATTGGGSTACSSSASRRTRAPPQAYLAIGMSFVQESKYPNAAAEFQKVLTVYPTAPEVPGGDVAAVAGVRAAALLHRRAGAARAISSSATRSRRAPTDAKGELKTIAKLPKSELHELSGRARDDGRQPMMQRNVTVTFMVVPALTRVAARAEDLDRVWAALL